MEVIFLLDIIFPKLSSQLLNIHKGMKAFTSQDNEELKYLKFHRINYSKFSLFFVKAAIFCSNIIIVECDIFIAQRKRISNR